MANTYLQRTFGSGNQQIWTWSGWIKRNKLGTDQQIFGRQLDGSNIGSIRFQSDDAIRVNNITSGTGVVLYTTMKFRDTNGWYHLVVVFKGAESTASDRVDIYVNGEEIDFTVISSTTAGNGYINGSGDHFIGKRAPADNDRFLEAVLSHIHFIDGTAYSPSDFGETDATTGIWKPKTAPSVTYGTNGFFLKFENSGAFGTDSSGNSNNFTVNGTMTQTIDTPSNVFATWNPLSGSASNTYSNGNTTVSYPNNFSRNANGTLAFNSGKYYGEFKRTGAANLHVGIVGNTFLEDGRIVTDTSSSHTYNMRGHTGCVTLITNTGDQDIFVDGSDSGTNVDFFTSAGDIVMVAFDADTKKIWFGKNGTWSSSGNPATGANPSYTYSGTATSDFTFGADTENGSSCNANFGNGYFGTTAVSSAQNPDDGIGIFEYDVPTGYKALCTKSINAQEYD